MREREMLLREPGRIYQKPFIEFLPHYRRSGLSPRATAERLGLGTDVGEFLETGLFGANDIDLFTHQVQALTLGTKPLSDGGRHVVITSGTGSGKTECFLMPVISRLVRESEQWPSPDSPEPYWWRERTGYTPKRRRERRPTAVRALFLYPLNALIEDQMVRLRNALDSEVARNWLDTNRGGNRFYFGGYNGRTPLPGIRTPGRERSLREHLRNMEREREALRPGDQALLPDPTDAEMVARWDMQTNPPDILVTNFSMLNIMLMRKIEAGIFHETRRWLQRDTSNTFTLVVDELHSYRGTPGTEVALTLKLLLDRLGLSPDSPQLRIIATSASLESTAAGRRFLTEFFGAREDRFELIPGEPIEPPGSEPGGWQTHTEAFARFAVDDNHETETALTELVDELGGRGNNPEGELGTQLAELGIPKLLFRSTEPSNGRPPVASIDQIADRLFPEDVKGKSTAETLERAVDGMVLASSIGRHPDMDSPILASKIHMFFRNLPGLWACCDPACNAVLDEGERPVGRLFSEPRLACSCGSRVLDLLYCQTCGDVFLGGYRSDSGRGSGFFLTADFPDVEKLPDWPGRGQVLDDYTVFWPSSHEPPREGWNVRGSRVEWQRGYLDPQSGLMHHARDDWLIEGWYIRLTEEAADPVEVRAIPKYCPNCDDCWAETRFGPGTYISPVRGTRTAFTKVAQVLGDGLLAMMYNQPEERKLVMFSDTRRDAAELARDLEYHHYLDLLRNILLRSTRTASLREGYQAYEKEAKGEDLTESEARRAGIFEDRHPTAARALLKKGVGRSLTSAEQDEISRIESTLEAGTPLPDVWDEMEFGLVALGVNPAGIARWATREEDWTQAYTWREDGRVEHNLGAPAALRTHRRSIKNAMVNEGLHQIFSGRRRSLEDLGFGYVTFASAPRSICGLDPESSGQVADAAIRILGQSRRFEYLPVPQEAEQRIYRRQPRESPPRVLQRYLRRVAEAHDCDYDRLVLELQSWLEESGAVMNYLLRDASLRIPRVEDSPDGWVCEVCGQRHLHRAASVCTSCHEVLPHAPVTMPNPEDDYYGRLATDPATKSRMHCEELTGQTDSIDGFKRLRLFQGKYRNDENRAVDVIDILNVTTTMESGVDIGKLRMIMMANMPPERFNYQQRSGRCGRRGQGISHVLTFCKGRSHDDYYFTNLEAMTADPPPSPYLDLRRPLIVKRVLAAEVLRRAFDDTGLGTQSSDRDSVHGEFGPRQDWNTEVEGDSRQKREIIWDWMRNHEEYCRHTVEVLTMGAPDLQEQEDELVSYLLDGSLMTSIDRVVSTSSEEYLSQALAWEGILPMFGFPTGLRQLYLERPRVQDGEMVEKTISRDIKIAISEFAPGSEFPKDKELHHSVGIAHYRRAYSHGRQIAVLSDNLLGTEETVSYCTECMLLNPEAPEVCPGCHAPLGSPRHQELVLSYPKGFRTDYQPGEGRPGEETRTYASAARSVIPALVANDAVSVARARCWLKEGRFYYINDNNWRLFHFQQTSRHGWIEEGQLDRAGISEDYRIGNPLPRALAARRISECLVMEPDRPLPDPDLDFRIANVGVRACFYSFGFLLQRAAASLLDVDPRELQVGVDASRVGGGPVIGRVYLADSLANGAGYARYLSTPENLAPFLEDIAREGESIHLKGMANHFEDPAVCDTSCYNCLRSYQNLRYHGLLNWLLAADTARLFTHGEVPSLPTGGRWESVLEPTIESMGDGLARTEAAGLPALRHTETGHIGTFSHPFLRRYPESQRTPLIAEAHREAVERLEDSSCRVIHLTYFDLIHRPWWVEGRIAAGRLPQ